MLTLNKNLNSASRILLFFCDGACTRRQLADMPGGKTRLFLPREETGLSGDFEITLTYGAEGWKIGEKVLSEKLPFYLDTEHKEKVLLLLGSKAASLLPAGKIQLRQERAVVVGNAFQNEVFYDCYSLVDARHLTIFFEDDDWKVRGHGGRGIYLNGKALWETESLKKGDVIDLYGLRILILRNLLVCVSFCGVCRAAEREEIREAEKLHREEREKAVWIERRHDRERDLHKGEFEIMLPEVPKTERKMPLLIGLGPTLTMVLPMLLMAQVSSRMMGGGSGFYYISLVMSGSSALLALFWGMVNHWYSQRMKKREEKERERQYWEYLEGAEHKLLEQSRENKAILESRYPPLSAFLGEEKGSALVLWNRYFRQKGFLALRMGTGEIPFQIQVKTSLAGRKFVQGRLAEEGRKTAEKFQVLSQAPAVIDFYEHRQVGICGPLYREGKGEILLQLLMQIGACHCYTEVKIVCFYHEGKSWDRKIADCIRWMPHSWSACRKERYLAGNEAEAARILPPLTKELLRAGEKGEKGIRIPWYFVVLLHEELIREEALYRCITDPEKGYPVSVLFAGMEQEALPKSCRCFVTGTLKEGELLDLGTDRINRRKISLEGCSYKQAQTYVRNTAGFRVREEEGDVQIPEKVPFLQLYGCRRVEELESQSRWKFYGAGDRLKVPIGCRGGGSIIYLDIHEKFHGPHGLIAGTTGSGKSELIQTYLLSVAVSFGPEDVNFFMIDYKGGGTGNSLKELPHCAGVISNLSGNQIKRAMWAITSENKRRQKLLSDFQVNHIDAYTKLYREKKAKSPMPHLILVVDEFAELKKEEPEFMQEIISLAQVGRSLGVHLILATQKPAGTVDDKIWSNAKFRLCLRVQDRQDSMDMLHNGDAAMLTMPGQCYLQIGNHEYYELFQTGYCGGSYVEEEQRKVKAALLKNTGERVEPEAEKASGRVSQIQALVDYVNHVAREGGYAPAQPLWLPELPERVTVSELRKLCDRENNGEDQKGILLGLCDDPENQGRLVLAYEPAQQGHLAVCGGPATGKTTLLRTILWQLTVDFEPDQVWTLVVNVGQDSLGCFLAMPGCLGVLGEKREIDLFFYHLKALFEKRKRQPGERRLPALFMVIDDFGSFYQLLEEREQALFLRIASEGPGLGIYLILSASGAGEISGRLFEKIRTTLALELSDRFQYGDVLRQYYIPVQPKENQKGRGLCRIQERILEFQTALAHEELGDYACMELIAKKGKEREEEMKKRGKLPPAKIPQVPREADYEMLAQEFEKIREKLPLGYCLSTGERCGISLKKKGCFLISGVERTGRSTLLRCLIEGALRRGALTVLLDSGKKFEDFRERKGLFYLTESSRIESLHRELERQREKEQGKKEPDRAACVFIGDIGDFCNIIYRFGEEKEKRCRFWEQAARGETGLTLLAGIYHPGRDYEAAGTAFFREFTLWQQGIHLGGNPGEQRALSFDDLSYADQNRREEPGIGYFKEGAGKRTRRLLLPQYGGEKKEEG